MEWQIRNKLRATVCAALAVGHGGVALAQAAAGMEGRYDSGTVDTITRLYVLPDQHFCLTFMGGSLDLLVGGKWQRLPGQSGKGQRIQLQESRQLRDPFVLFQQAMPERKAGELVIGARTMSYAEGAVLGFAKHQLRPVFAPEQHRFASSYTLKVPAHTSSLYLGLPKPGDGASYEVRRYPLTATQPAVLQFDREAQRPLFASEAQIVGDRLVLDSGQGFQRRTAKLEPQLVKNVMEQCVMPALQGREGARAQAVPAQEQEDVPASAIVGKPWFTQDD